MRKNKKNWFMWKKWAGGICALLLCLLLAGCSGSTKLADCFSKDELTTLSQENITLAESGDYEAFLEKMDPSVSSALTEEVYNPYLDTVKAKGAFQSFGKPAFVGQTVKETGDNYAAVILTANYEDGKLQYTLGYNEDLKLFQKSFPLLLFHGNGLT